jgi:ABC-type branched-subunit amino acid transport system ATPase component
VSAGLVVEDVVVRYGGVRPLDGVSLEFERGVCGLVGPNGAGKTTFFNVLSGFARAAAGSVRYDGVDLLAMSPPRRARWGLRRTFQQEQVIQELSAEDNVLLTAEHTGAGRAEVRSALDFVGLERADRRGTALTMLERRLVEFAKAVVGDPKVVLLDEPAAGLSSEETQRLADLITAMPEAYGVLVVLVDHDMDLVSSVCGTVAVLDFGKRIALGPTADVLASEQVKRAYLGTADVEQV